MTRLRSRASQPFCAAPFEAYRATKGKFLNYNGANPPASVLGVIALLACESVGQLARRIPSLRSPPRPTPDEGQAKIAETP
jgi:hypothetical protein